jgi:hypothetical protein
MEAVTMKIPSFIAFALILSTCKTTQPTYDSSSRLNTSTQAALDYSPARESSLNQEYIPANEVRAFSDYAAEFAKIHREQQNQNQAKAGARNNLRGMHAKGHGCVQAEFKAAPPEVRYKVGIFADSVPRNAVIRFSNGSGLVEGDGSRDLRGMAVKIFMPGLRQVNGAVEANAQDILCTNAPVHHTADIVELMEFTKAMAAGGLKKTVFLATNPSITTRLLSQTQRRVDSVLNESYWSRAPFSFGPDRTVKYVIKPLEQLPLIDSSGLSEESWLAQDLDDQVKTRDKIVFGIYAQFQTDPVSEPIEDHAKEWTTGEVKLGELTIKKQIVDRSATCENLVFNPWNSGIDHRPLGNMNRARKFIYEAAKAYRQERPAN